MSTPNTSPRVYQVRAKTQQVVEHHYNDAKPGKPLRLLIPGGLIALASLALIVYLAYVTFLDQTMESGQGILLMLLLAPFYIGGVFLFCYGYELYDVGKALRDTAIVVFVTLAAVVIVAVLFMVIGGSKGGSSKSSSSKSNSSKSGGVDLGNVFGGGSSSGSSGSAASQPSSTRRNFDMGPIIIGGGTRTVTKEVVREVPVAPPEPLAVPCENCGRLYIPAETKFACPNCGAPATPKMVEESNKNVPQ